MRTGNELIQATRAYAVDDPTRSWFHVLSTGALLLLAMAGTIWNFHLAGRIACSVLGGLLMVRFFVIYHDHQHRAILAGSLAADVLMRVFGVLILSPSNVWRSSHNYHHSHNSRLRSAHIGSFPILTRESYRKASRGERLKYLLARHPLTMLFGYVTIFLFGMCLLPGVHAPRKHADSLLALAVHAALATALLVWLGWPGLLLTLVVPYFIASALGSYLFYAQHNFPAVSFKDNTDWNHEEAALESSSFMKMGPVMNWFTANIGYHHIHHLNSRIPFYRLPEAIREIPELQSARTTSLHPAEILRCLRLKVWDPEVGAMTGLRELRADSKPVAGAAP